MLKSAIGRSYINYSILFNYDQSFSLPNAKFMFDTQNYTRSGVREFRSNISTVIAEVQLPELI